MENHLVSDPVILEDMQFDDSCENLIFKLRKEPNPQWIEVFKTVHIRYGKGPIEQSAFIFNGKTVTVPYSDTRTPEEYECWFEKHLIRTTEAYKEFLKKEHQAKGQEEIEQKQRELFEEKRRKHLESLLKKVKIKKDR